MRKSIFSPSQLLNDVVALHRATAQKKNLRINVQIGESAAVEVEGGSAHIRQVLGNLLSNAIKFTASGHIDVSQQCCADAARPGMVILHYAVADTGIGIGVEQQARLFQPFSQADSSISRKYGGTGLGLSICKRLVELMQGKIVCESEAAKGTTFRFEVPCRKVGTSDGAKLSTAEAVSVPTALADDNTDTTPSRRSPPLCMAAMSW